MDLLDKLKDAATTGNVLYSEAIEEITKLKESTEGWQEVFLLIKEVVDAVGCKCDQAVPKSPNEPTKVDDATPPAFYPEKIKCMVQSIRDNCGCSYAGAGRGDCEHAVGLPGKSIPGQHDGDDDTVDHYGKPNGWCWFCWHSHQLAEAHEMNALCEDCCTQDVSECLERKKADDAEEN